jgi:hypothetical protein
MAWSPFQRSNAGISWVQHPGDYANQIPTTPATAPLGAFFGICGLLSLPFNVLALMRLQGWSWWGALIGAMFLGAIPLIGQIGYIVLAFLGAYYFIEAKFDWREAISPSPQTLSLEEMSPQEFEKLRSVLHPIFVKRCKQELAETNNMKGKLLEGQAAFCECIGRLPFEVFTQEQIVAISKSGWSTDTIGKLKAVAQSRCI